MLLRTSSRAHQAGPRLGRLLLRRSVRGSVIGSSPGLDEISCVQCELIRTINRDRLLHPLGAVDLEVGQQVAAIVQTLLNYCNGGHC